MARLLGSRQGSRGYLSATIRPTYSILVALTQKRRKTNVLRPARTGSSRLFDRRERRRKRGDTTLHVSHNRVTSSTLLELTRFSAGAAGRGGGEAAGAVLPTRLASYGTIFEVRANAAKACDVIWSWLKLTLPHFN